MLLRDTIFVVDPSPSNRTILRRIFENRFNVLEAGNLAQAELLFRQNHSFIAAMLLDMKLAHTAPADVRQWLTDDPDLAQIPRIAMLDREDSASEHLAFQMGATDMIFRPLHAAVAEQRVSYLIELFRSKWNLENLVEEQEAALRQSSEAMVDALSSVIEGRSAESGQHVLRIRRFTRILLEELARFCPEYGLTEKAIQSISSAAALHDIGKIVIPDGILNKRGLLTPLEYEVMKSHASAGSEILARLDNLGSEDYLRYAYNICRYHHERWNGEGYPEGLAGDDIPLCAQVVGLADSYDALTSSRSYKPAISAGEAESMILNGECGSFSPLLLECFKSVRGDMAQLAEAYADGLSPRNDRITAPLAPPVSTAMGTLQKLLNKYAAMLRYAGATVIDVDLDKGAYHVAYDPEHDFDFLVKPDDREVTFRRWSERVQPAGDRTDTPATLERTLEDFYTSGLRQKNFPCVLRGDDGRERPCAVALLRPASREKVRQFMLVCRVEKEGQNGEIPDARSGAAKAARAMLKSAVAVRYDHALTLLGSGEPLCRLLGFDEEERRSRFGASLAEMIPASARDGVRRQLSQQLQHGPVCEVEIPLQGRDGDVQWFMGKGFLTENEEGSEQLYLSLSDVSTPRRTQETLKQALDERELLMAQSEDIMFVLDLVKDRLSCSPKWEERFGYAPLSENISDTLEEASHFHPDDVPRFRERLEQLKAGAGFVELVLRIVDATGHYRWCQARAALQRDEEGRPARAVGVIIDMSQILPEYEALKGR